MSARTIVVGVDFGTTFTGVAYADSQRPDQVHVIKEWPNHAGRQEMSGKVSTKLCYQDGSIQWGALVDPEAPRDDVLEYFKLALDPQHIDKLQDGANLTKKTLLGQDIDKLVTEYLAGVGDHVMQYLRQQLGVAVMETTPFLVVVTYPAIWNEPAIQRTISALKRAWKMDSKPSWKIDRLTEPEAAALCVLQQLPKHDMSENDCIMVVDAGGGTVDLITYRIQKVSPSLVVSEAVPGAGGACGSAFLNDRFERLLVNTLGREDDFDGDVVQRALAKWDRVKKRFAMADIPAETFEIDVMGLADNKDLNIRRAKWKVSAADVFCIFDGVVLQILKLVTDQQAASQVEIQAVVLVGGFGQSTYLRERLEAHMGGNDRVRVLQPANAWTAIAEGAVLKGLAQTVPEHKEMPIIADRKARKHFGFELSSAFNHTLHSEIAEKKRWHAYRGQYVVDIMQWFIKKGDPVTVAEPYFRAFSVVSKVNEGRPNLVTLTILSDNTSEVAPLENNHNVNTLCVTVADLSRIPRSQIAQRQGADGLMYYVVSCELEIRYDNNSTAYTLLHNGHRYDTVTAEYV